MLDYLSVLFCKETTNLEIPMAIKLKAVQVIIVICANSGFHNNKNENSTPSIPKAKSHPQNFIFKVCASSASAMIVEDLKSNMNPMNKGKILALKKGLEISHKPKITSRMPPATPQL